jgi:hypothetical protein
MPKLRTLLLNGYVNDIETHALERMPCLTRLGLGGCAWKASASHEWLYSLPSSIEELGAVPSIYGPTMDRPPPSLGHCSVAPSVATLSNLKQLYFWRVPTLGPREWRAPFPHQLTALTAIIFIDCLLLAMPNWVVSRSTLKYLDVSRNPVQGFTVGPYLSKLEVLRVCSCEITIFPLDSISKATALQQLHLDGNNIEWTEAAREAVAKINIVTGV